MIEVVKTGLIFLGDNRRTLLTRLSNLRSRRAWQSAGTSITERDWALNQSEVVSCTRKKAALSQGMLTFEVSQFPCPKHVPRFTYA